jgi:hypothetical protein
VTIPRERVLAELEEPDRIVEEMEEMDSGPPEEEWLEKLLEKVDNDLSYEEKGHLKEILLQYQDCFSRSEYDLGHTEVVEHTIDTGNHPPIKQALRRQPLAYLPEIDKQVEEMLAQGIIESSASPWASNVVIVVKKDQSLRFCIDLGG